MQNQSTVFRKTDTVNRRDITYAYLSPCTMVLLGTHYRCVLSSYFMCLYDAVTPVLGQLSWQATEMSLEYMTESQIQGVSNDRISSRWLREQEWQASNCEGFKFWKHDTALLFCQWIICAVATESTTWQTILSNHQVFYSSKEEHDVWEGFHL